MNILNTKETYYDNKQQPNLAFTKFKVILVPNSSTMVLWGEIWGTAHLYIHSYKFLVMFIFVGVDNHLSIRSDQLTEYFR